MRGSSVWWTSRCKSERGLKTEEIKFEKNEEGGPRWDGDETVEVVEVVWEGDG